MSQIIISKEKKSDRSKEIEEHLSSVCMEALFYRTRENSKTVSKIDICPYCELHLEKPYLKPRYSGIRGRCDTCEVNWNLS